VNIYIIVGLCAFLSTASLHAMQDGVCHVHTGLCSTAVQYVQAVVPKGIAICTVLVALGCIVWKMLPTIEDGSIGNIDIIDGLEE